jgi:uncharacterized protein
MSDKSAFLSRAASAYARMILRNPGKVLLLLVGLGAAAAWATTRLTIEPNQLDLISQELPEVKEVKRVIDMVGGAGYLMVGLRGNHVPTLKRVSDELARRLLADKAHVRFVTYKVPVEFIQDNMVLFIKTEDLLEAQRRIKAFIKDQLRRNNPFHIELRKTAPVKLDLQDLVDKYSSIGKKSISDDYYISKDKKMLILLIKPMWNSTELDKTAAFRDALKGELARVGKATGIALVEDYAKMGDARTLYYGFSGSYITNVDDSFAITESLGPVSFYAFAGIVLIAILFFRRIAPSLIVISGMALGTVLTMGFTKATIGELNMVTSILGGILMGFGVDYGIHFTYRTRIELGLGKSYDQAIHDAIVNAGRPALVAAVVTGGSFFVLMVSEFRGFSQFGFLAGFGTLIIGFTLFSWSPAILALLGRRWPELPKRLIGTMTPLGRTKSGGDFRVPRPALVLAVCVLAVLGLCAFAVPWKDIPAAKNPSLLERLKGGVHFDYNTRALMPANQPSVKLQDEIRERFDISADPTAVYTKTLEEAREVYDELTGHPEKYPSIDQVVSLYSFVPPAATAARNAKILAEWREELKEIDINGLPDEVQANAKRFMHILEAKPFGVREVPEIYSAMFRHLPTTRPENHGYLTFIYPSVDLWDGKKMLEFADQTINIVTKSGHVYHSAGTPILMARLARIVLWDGKLTVILATLWILLMHFLDFRSPKLALASVIPLGVGLVMMLGAMSLTNHRLNFMNIIMMPILLGFGVSHGLYLLHRFLEGTSPVVALRSVGAAVASSTLTAIAGFGSLFAASHNGLKSMGYVASLGLTTTLVVSFTVLAAVLQLMHDQRTRAASPIAVEAAPPGPSLPASSPALVEPPGGGGSRPLHPQGPS